MRNETRSLPPLQSDLFGHATHRELNATVEMLIQINTLNQNCLSSKCDKNLSEVYIISYCFYFVPESHVSISIGDTLEDKTEK